MYCVCRIRFFILLGCLVMKVMCCWCGFVGILILYFCIIVLVFLWLNVCVRCWVLICCVMLCFFLLLVLMIWLVVVGIRCGVVSYCGYCCRF